MIILFYMGSVLLCAAFLAAAGEVAVRSVPGMTDAIISAYDLWQTMSPGSLVHAHIIIQRNIGQWLWDPVLKTVLILPAWLIIGLPGVCLAWLGYPGQQFANKEQIEEDSFFIIDALAKKAMIDGYGDHQDDHALSHSLDEEFIYEDDLTEHPISNKVEHEDSLYLFDELAEAVIKGTNGYERIDRLGSDSQYQSPYEKFLVSQDVEDKAAKKTVDGKCFK